MESRDIYMIETTNNEMDVIKDKLLVSNTMKHLLIHQTGSRRNCAQGYYTDDGMVGSLNSDWLHHSMNFLVDLFRRYGLAANVTKSHTMTYQPWRITSGDVGGGHGAEVHGGGILIPSETPKADTIPRVFI